MKMQKTILLALLLSGLFCACSDDSDPEEILPELPEHVVDHAKEVIIPDFVSDELLPMSKFAKTAKFVELELPGDKLYSRKMEITNRGEALICVNDEVVRFGIDGKKLNSYGFAGQKIIDFDYDPYNDRLLINSQNENNTATLITYDMNGEEISRRANHVFNHSFGVLDASHLVFYGHDLISGFIYVVTDMDIATKYSYSTLPEENAALGITTIRRQNRCLYAYCKLTDTPYRITADGLELLYRFKYTGSGNWGMSLYPESHKDAYCLDFWQTDHYLFFALVDSNSRVYLSVKDSKTKAFYSGTSLDDDVSGASFPYVPYLDFQQQGDKLYILTFDDTDEVLRHYLYTCTL